jgi:hypothetical protein
MQDMDWSAIGLWSAYNVALPLSAALVFIPGAGWVIGSEKLTFRATILEGQLFFYCVTVIAVLLKDLHHRVEAGGVSIYSASIVLLVVNVFLFAVVLTNRDRVVEKRVFRLSVTIVVVSVAWVLGVRISEELL